MKDITQQLKDIFDGRLKENEPLSKHTNYRLGGPARWFVEAQTVDEIVQAINLAKDNGIPYFALGGGSNTLASDEGFEGLIIKLANRNYKIDGTTVVADAGVITASLARATANAGLEGFEWAITLPGTIGGAVRGNAGCFGGETKDAIVSIRVLRDGEVVELPNEELNFGYRESAIKHSSDIVLDVTMQLKEGNVDVLKQRLDEVLQKRKDTQPLSAGSAGCIFKNYEFEDESELDKLKKEADIPESMLQNKVISAGWLIDQLGLKGKSIGDAQISNEHGNFIVNLGNATASDIAQLIAIVKTAARDRYGIMLHEEVQYLGF